MRIYYTLIYHNLVSNQISISYKKMTSEMIYIFLRLTPVFLKRCTICVNDEPSSLIGKSLVHHILNEK